MLNLDYYMSQEAGTWTERHAKAKKKWVKDCKAVVGIGRKYDRRVTRALARLAKRHFPGAEVVSLNPKPKECASVLRAFQLAWALKYPGQPAQDRPPVMIQVHLHLTETDHRAEGFWCGRYHGPRQGPGEKPREELMSDRESGLSEAELAQALEALCT